MKALPSVSCAKGLGRENQLHGSLHRFHRVLGRTLRRDRRRRRVRFGAAALFLRRLDPRQLRLRPPAVGRSDLLGHRGDLLSRHPHHRRSPLRQRPPQYRRAIDVFATLVLLFVVAVQTFTLYDKVWTTRANNVLTFDLRLPTWPF